jgi:hypothetical protein
MNDPAGLKLRKDMVPVSVPTPFDLPSALGNSTWRDDFRWPIAYLVLRERQMATVSAILDIAAGIVDPDTRALALLLQGRLGILLRMAGELALLHEGAAQSKLKFAGTPPEFEFLAGRTNLPEVGSMVPPRKKDQNVNLAFGRRLARIASWTRSPLRLAKAMIAPDNVAVSHNHLMREVASRSPEAISFRHAEHLLIEGRALAPPDGGKARAHEVVERFETVIDRCYPVAADMRTRMREIYWSNAVAIAERAARELDGLSRLRKVPRSLWFGSAGPHAVRALALEVRRRGGVTTGFDHGGSFSMVHDPHSAVLRELAVNSRYVLPSAACVAALANTGAIEMGRPFGETELVAGKGDPTFAVPRQSQRNTSVGKPRIYYIVTIFRGLRQLVPTCLPDPIYWDWQCRVLEEMRRRGVDLICKPHPEGILKGKRHPLEDVGQVEYRRFEDIRDGAGGFLYDYLQSTTFWEAVCTDRPITLIDFGITKLNATVAPLIERRCRVIKVRWNDRNLPSIDFDEMADAIMSTQNVDPTEFRRLLTGRD